jgi:hypothetical protein
MKITEENKQQIGVMLIFYLPLIAGLFFFGTSSGALSQDPVRAYMYCSWAAILFLIQLPMVIFKRQYKDLLERTLIQRVV